jgi:hypothetical protein
MKNNCDRCNGELKLSIMSKFNTAIRARFARWMKRKHVARRTFSSLRHVGAAHRRSGLAWGVERFCILQKLLDIVL